MNFLDPYDIANSTTPPPTEDTRRPQQSLEEEVTQVIGSLGGFWGRIRQQGQVALQTARKDLGDVVIQAQKEIGRYTAAGPTTGNTATSDADAATTTRDTSTDDGARTSSPTSSVETYDAGTSTAPSETSSHSSYQTLFSRFQSALPPNIVSTLRSNIPESVKHASENVDFAQWRTTLSTEFQRVQGVTRAQAEEYVKKSEAMLRETMKEAGEALKDAVKIIPPEEATTSASSSSGLIWDGSDIWMLPSSESSDSSIGSKGKGKETGAPESSGSLSDLHRVATRAESLLKRLKHDPEIIKHEPDAAQYTAWLEKEVEPKGGIDSEYWKTRIAEERGNTVDGAAIQATHKELVPLVMDDSTLWKRYFFRVDQIRREEEKRKALLQAAEHEDDFSWEDDDEDTTSPTIKHDPETPRAELTPSTEKATTPTPQGHEKDSSKDTNSSSPQLLTPSGTSPRESEDGSYDVVSSSNASAAGEKQKTQDLSDGDSDWE